MKAVYLVRQTQTEADYYNYTVYVVSDYDEAVRRAKLLNEHYADNVVLDEDGLFVEVKDYSEDYHYYDIQEMIVDTPMADFQ
jgi:hypothetical protein